jgi:hypothetical protein
MKNLARTETSTSLSPPPPEILERLRDFPILDGDPARDVVLVTESRVQVIPMAVAAAFLGVTLEASPGRCLLIFARAGRVSIVDAPTTRLLRGGEG